MNRFDYIVAGAGAAGLSLIMHMIDSGELSNKTILLVDRAQKIHNDRTWCFWEETPGLFDSVVYKRWSRLWFHGYYNKSRLNDISPYQYKMIRSIDFYNYCFEKIRKQTKITVKYGVIHDIVSDADNAYVVVDGEKYYSSYVFSSIPQTSLAGSNSYFLWQHFKGWFIETDKHIFDPEEATLMDFRIDQQNDTRFVYVMPFSKTDALVEYTVFSENRLDDAEYNEHLTHYCTSNLRIHDGQYKVAHEEFGMIPMTNHVFPAADSNIIYIGSAGGQTKASSGYTFSFIQKHSRQLVKELIKNNSPHVTTGSKRFHFYDSILLKILAEKKLAGAKIFTELFEHNRMTDVLKFLDNETSVTEDLKLIKTLPTGTFMSAAVSHLLR